MIASELYLSANIRLARRAFVNLFFCLVMSSCLCKKSEGAVFPFRILIEAIEDGIDDAVDAGHVDEANHGSGAAATSTKQRSMTFVLRGFRQRCLGKSKKVSSRANPFQLFHHRRVDFPPASAEATKRLLGLTEVGGVRGAPAAIDDRNRCARSGRLVRACRSGRGRTLKPLGARHPKFFGATLAHQKLHPPAGHSAENCTEQMGIPGPWYERLPHFRMNFTPSSGAELQSEYLVPRDRGFEAILAVEELRELVTPHPIISELRTVDADKHWMSPCSRRASMAIHFTWKPEWPAVKEVLPMIEEKLDRFNARPHWAKLFTMSPTRLKSLYGRLPDYQALLAHYDPHGKFRNDYLNTNIYAR